MIFPLRGQPTPKKRIATVLIGLQYDKGKNHLEGTKFDITNMYRLFQSIYGNVNEFTLEQYVYFDGSLDGLNTVPLLPEKHVIVHKLNELAAFSKTKNNCYDAVYIFYAGHGDHIKDTNGDEIDGQDEALILHNYKYLTDDELCEILLKYEKNTNLRIIMDCCHSGTMTDLPIMYKNNEKIEVNKNKIVLNTDVIQISGCKDNQYSLGIELHNGKNTGMLTYSLIQTLRNKFTQNPTELVDMINEKIKSTADEYKIPDKYIQISEITTNITDDINLSDFFIYAPCIQRFCNNKLFTFDQEETNNKCNSEPCPCNNRNFTSPDKTETVKQDKGDSAASSGTHTTFEAFLNLSIFSVVYYEEIYKNCTTWLADILDKYT